MGGSSRALPHLVLVRWIVRPRPRGLFLEFALGGSSRAWLPSVLARRVVFSLNRFGRGPDPPFRLCLSLRIRFAWNCSAAEQDDEQLGVYRHKGLSAASALSPLVLFESCHELLTTEVR